MTDPVAAQYEQWVYPKPIADLSEVSALGKRSLSDPALLGSSYWPDLPPREDLKILIAGCGPNVAPIFAHHHPLASVVGIDISETSLSHAMSLKSKYGLSNLSLHQCRLEDIASLGQSFDLIQCVGVLHHTQNPDLGLRALGKHLNPDGVVYVMLYGRYGRDGIYMLQEMFRRLGLDQSKHGIATVREVVAALQAVHPARRLLNRIDDLEYDAGVIDLLLHHRDRAFTVEQCLSLVGSADLVFQGWGHNFFYYPDGQCPPALVTRLNDLPDSALWSIMELFHSQIDQHVFFACRRDRDPRRYATNFYSDAILDMVPVPFFSLRRLNGADGTLKLQHDNFPPVTLRAEAASLAGAMNGHTTLRDCAKASGVENVSKVKHVMRSLWRLDLFRLVHQSAMP